MLGLNGTPDAGAQCGSGSPSGATECSSCDAGYHPDGGLLEACGLKPDPDTLKPVIDPDTLESGDVPGIYLAGSVSAGYETGNVFIENGRFDSEKIFANLGPELG